MAKLFIFAIGGTGSRVLESLTMLLASGVTIEADEIIPIIVDPDGSNGNLDRGVEALKKYCEIRRLAEIKEQPMFFGANIADDLTPNDRFRFQLSNVQGIKFKEYINNAGLDDANQALIASLFTQENLELGMDEGFKGNPNIGSIVLDQFVDSPNFEVFCKRFAQGDRIFIISSIFGGTGAAGFPLLLKNLRQAQTFTPAPPNAQAIANSVIGAITYLPYFGLDPLAAGSVPTIDSATFVSKSKAALKYYVNGVNTSVNALYHVGDPASFSNCHYKYGEGKKDQKNDAHFVELMGALAIIDFMKNKNFETLNENPVKSFAFDYALNENKEPVCFNTLGPRSKGIVAAPLTQFTLAGLYWESYMNQSFGQPWATDGGKSSQITSDIYTTDLYVALKNFVVLFNEWLSQIKTNKISFAPLDTEVNNSNLFKNLVTDNNQPNTSFWEKGENFDRMNHILNKISQKLPPWEAHQRLLPLFYKATASIVKDKYGFK